MSEMKCPYCESDEVKERSGLYGERPVAPEMNHIIPVKRHGIFRCLECGSEFEEGEIK